MRAISPPSTSTVWSASTRSPSIGTTFTCTKAAGPGAAVAWAPAWGTPARAAIRMPLAPRSTAFVRSTRSVSAP